MGSNKEIYDVEFTEDCILEMDEIYEYISKKLVAKEPAKRLIQKVKESILVLSEAPKLYMKINKMNKPKREYRRMTIKNYVILYTVDEEKKKVYIAHMYYGGRNYLSK